MKKNKAFTLIELLVSIVVLGILAAISISTYGNFIQKATIAKHIANAVQTNNRVRTCYDEFGTSNCLFSEQKCSELGWTAGRWIKDEKVTADCAEAENLSPDHQQNYGYGNCVQNVGWTTAYEVCHDAGARLCTREEMQKDVEAAAGSGCNHDFRMVWTNSPCGDNGFIVSAGRWSSFPSIAEEYCEEDLGSTLKVSGTFPVTYGVSNKDHLAVRCCADEN